MMIQLPEMERQRRYPLEEPLPIVMVIDVFIYVIIGPRLHLPVYLKLAPKENRSGLIKSCCSNFILSECFVLIGTSKKYYNLSISYDDDKS